jgi:hypothetical protein
MQDCCRTVPRRGKYWVIAVVVALAVAVALIGGGGAEPTPAAPRGAEQR